MKKLLIVLFLLPLFAKAQNEDSTWIVNNYTKKEFIKEVVEGN